MLEFSVPKITTLSSIPKSRRRRRVVFVTMPDGDPFDLIGPMTVLNDTNWQLENSGRPDLGYDIEVVTNKIGTVYHANGFRMVIDKSCYQVRGDIDTVVFQAVDYEGNCLKDRRFINWVKRIAPRTRRLVTACVGTYVLAEAGLLDGRRAATHWSACDDFQRRYPDVQLEPEPIFIKDGKFYSSAGVTSILDLMFSLVEEDYCSELALRVAQSMVMFLRRPANQSQFSTQLNGSTADDMKIRTVMAYVAEHLDRKLSVEALAKMANMSPRNFTRVFTREVGVTPGKFVEQARLESARGKLEQSKLPINQVASQCGYRTADSLRAAFDRNLGVGPSEYRRRFTTLQTVYC
jgi:transcriptional regulator GlxA family with amidase domain